MEGEIREALWPLHSLHSEESEAIAFESVPEIMRPVRNVFVALQVLLGVVGTVTLAMSGVSVANLMIAIVGGRRRELAMRRACGARRSDLLLQLMVETLVIVGLGGAVGVASRPAHHDAPRLRPATARIPGASGFGKRAAHHLRRLDCRWSDRRHRPGSDRRPRRSLDRAAGDLMELRESLRQAIEILSDHPRRVVASSLGVFWGAAAIVLLLAWGAGFREYMKSELGRFGRSAVTMYPASTSSGFPGYRKGVRVEISREDAAAAARENADLIETILPEHLSEERVLVEAGDRVRRLDMSAADHRYAHYRKFAIGQGRFFDASDVEDRRAVAILGFEAAVDLFGDAERALGGRIRVEGRGFEVIGVADPQGPAVHEYAPARQPPADPPDHHRRGQARLPEGGGLEADGLPAPGRLC